MTNQQQNFDRSLDIGVHLSRGFRATEGIERAEFWWGTTPTAQAIEIDLRGSRADRPVRPSPAKRYGTLKRIRRWRDAVHVPSPPPSNDSLQR